MLIRKLLAFAIVSIAGHAYSITPEAINAIAIGEGDTRIEALRAAVAGADEKTVAFIQALSEDAVKVVAGKPVIVKDDKAVDPVTGAGVRHCRPAEDVMNNNRMRGEIDGALASLKLLSPDEAVRREAVKDPAGRCGRKQTALARQGLCARVRRGHQEFFGYAARRGHAEQR
jgi:urea transport system permease protein